MKEFCTCNSCSRSHAGYVTPWCNLLHNADASCCVLHLWYKLDWLRSEARKRLAYLGATNGYQNVPDVNDLVGAAENPQADPLLLSFSVSDIREEVQKLTAYLGKFRRTEEAAHLLDLLALTDDEESLFYIFAKETMAEVWNVLSAPFVAVQKKAWWQDTTTTDYAEGIQYLFEVHYAITAENTAPLHQTLLEAIVNRIIYKWLLLSYPDEAQLYDATFQQALTAIPLRVNEFKARWSGLFLPFAKAAMADVFDALQLYMPKHEKSYWWNDTQTEVTFTDDPLPDPAVEFYKGQYVKFNNELYMAVEDGSSDDFADKLVPTEDYRYAIHYGILLSCKSNINVIDPLDTAVFEAIVARIIYKWLKSAYPVEAPLYLEEYEEQLEKIKVRARKLDYNHIIDRIPRMF